MHFVPIAVETFSGYKADEYPKCFYLEEICFEILETSDRWYQTDSNPEGPPCDYFKVKTSGGALYILKHELNTDRWFLGI